MLAIPLEEALGFLKVLKRRVNRLNTNISDIFRFNVAAELDQSSGVLSGVWKFISHPTLAGKLIWH